MKNVILVFVMLTLSQASIAFDSTELKCRNSDGLELVVMSKKNPHNHADAFVTLTGPHVHLRGWAWLKESTLGSTLFSSHFFHLEGDFPQGSILKIVEKVRACGRGACEGRETIKTAKLTSADEEVYFNCF